MHITMKYDREKHSHSFQSQCDQVELALEHGNESETSLGQNVKTKQGKQTNACKARAVNMERLFQFQQGHTLALFKSQLQ